MSHDILDSGSGTDTCGRCGQAKEPTRLKSATCRTCDALSRSKRAPRTPRKPVTIALPLDVWDRLNAEATTAGVKIGTFLERRVITRDRNLQEKKPVSRNQTEEK